MPSSGNQLQHIQNFLIELAEGNFDSKLHISENEDEQTQAVKTGINMLVEELSSTIISKAFFNSVYNGINDLLIVVDECGKIVNVNHQVEKELGYFETELQKCSINQIIHLNDKDVFNISLSKVENANRIQDIGVNFVSKDHKVVPMSCSFSLLEDFITKKKLILVVAKNISALLTAKEQLSEKNDELNLFVYKASHDLKSPVSSMLGLNYLIKKSNDLEEIRHYHTLMEKSLLNLETILNELLIIGRITHGDFVLKPVDLNQLFDVIFSSVIPIHDPVKVNLEIDKSIGKILSEPDMVRSVLFNLIDNAYKYRNVSAEPFINVSVTKYHNGIQVVIEDNGYGIKKEQIPNVFKMFYRASEVSKGTGLGLYIVKTSINRLGGSISLQSEYKKGTKFIIDLPCEFEHRS